MTPALAAQCNGFLAGALPVAMILVAGVLALVHWRKY